MQNNTYVLVSACRNEGDYVDGLIDCIVSQRLRPACWIIVDDGSTDGTYERAASRVQDVPFLKVVKAPGFHSRSFTSQVYAAQYGAELLKGEPFDFIGFLDADIRLGAGYYEKVIQALEKDPQLGIAGGIVIDTYPDRRAGSRRGSEDHHVAGGVQLFRRQCFEQIGGYTPIDGGGQDTIAEVMAMMKGWRIRTFPEIAVEHLRPGGFSGDTVLAHGMKWGRKFRLLGYHPLYYFGQCVRRLGWRPYVIGSLCQLLGFMVAAMHHERRPVSPEFVCFLRKIQMQRLRSVLRVPAGPDR